MEARWTVPVAPRLSGGVAVPGDKSISHRALILGALARGRSRIERLPASADVRSTVAVLRQLGVAIAESPWAGDTAAFDATVTGASDGLAPARAALDCGNSGTCMRLLAGVLARQPFVSVLTGDRSLRSRPMSRIAEPLIAMGAVVETAEGARPPVRIHGADLRGVTYRSPVASAQVKSCVVLAGLGAAAPTTVIEPLGTRDHTERMLRAAGVAVTSSTGSDGTVTVTVTPTSTIAPFTGRVPGDPSSAAYWAAAAAVCPDSDVELTGVAANPGRDGFLRVLEQWGASIERIEREPVWNEPVVDLEVQGAALSGGTIEPTWVPRLIDELPLLAAIAPYTRDGVVIRGAAELRVKESDRIATIAAALRQLGVAVDEFPDGLAVAGKQRVGGGIIDAAGDHRIAMAMAVAAQRAAGPVEIVGADAIEVSYPGFASDLEALGAAR